MTATPVFLQTPQRGSVALTSGGSATRYAAFTPGANGSKVVAAICVGDFSGINPGFANTIALYINSGGTLSAGVVTGGTFYQIGFKSVPAAAGGIVANGPSVNVLDPIAILGMASDDDGEAFLWLNSGDFLCFEAGGGINTSLNITVFYFDF